MALSRQLSAGNSALTYVQGLLEDSPSEKYENHPHSNDLLEGLRQNYEDGKFCDVTLVVSGEEIKAHKVVLSSFSLYFKALFDMSWKENEQSRIVIVDFDFNTLKSLIDFAYSGNLNVNTSNVLSLLVAADFLQLDFVKISCGTYLKSLVNERNCIAMLIIANKFNASNLERYLLKYAARRFHQVSKSEDFFELPGKVLADLLQNENLVVSKGEDFLPSVEEQESVVLDTVFRYVSQYPKERQNNLLLEQLQNVRLLLLSHSYLESILENENFTDCPEAKNLVIKAMNNLDNPSPDEDNLPKLWSQQRKATRTHKRVHKVYANRVHVGPKQSCFDDGNLASDGNTHLKGMKIWIRQWDGRPVIGGIETYYSNGQISCHGGQDPTNDVEEFHLEDDERIIKVDVNSGWMVDHVKFYTNKNRVLGPYGGPGGSSHTEKPRGSFGYLGWIKGIVVLAQEKLAITKFSFVWMEYSLQLEKSHASSDDSDESSSDDESCSDDESITEDDMNSEASLGSLPHEMYDSDSQSEIVDVLW